MSHKLEDYVLPREEFDMLLFTSKCTDEVPTPSCVAQNTHQFQLGQKTSKTSAITKHVASLAPPPHAPTEIVQVVASPEFQI